MTGTLWNLLNMILWDGKKRFDKAFLKSVIEKKSDFMFVFQLFEIAVVCI